MTSDASRHELTKIVHVVPDDVSDLASLSNVLGECFSTKIEVAVLCSDVLGNLE